MPSCLKRPVYERCNGTAIERGDGKLDRTEFSKSTLYQSADERERDLLSKAFAAAASKADQVLKELKETDD